MKTAKLLNEVLTLLENEKDILFIGPLNDDILIRPKDKDIIKLTGRRIIRFDGSNFSVDADILHIYVDYNTQITPTYKQMVNIMGKRLERLVKASPIKPWFYSTVKKYWMLTHQNKNAIDKWCFEKSLITYAACCRLKITTPEELYAKIQTFGCNITPTKIMGETSNRLVRLFNYADVRGTGVYDRLSHRYR